MRLRPSLVLAVGALCALTVASACGLFIDPDALVSGVGLAPDGGGGADGGDASCVPTGPEVCDDGVDNDCNGETDCDDAACRPDFECVAPPPDGWTPIALAARSRAPCPDGFASPVDLRVVQGSGEHACECDCERGCAGDVSVTMGSDATCASGSETFQADTNGACTGNVGVDLGAFAMLAPASPTACPAKDVEEKQSATSGRTCVPPTAGGGCSDGRRCVRRSEGFASCIAKPGAEACPAAFPSRHRAGAGVEDTRSCTGCSCASSPCDVEIEVFSHPQCNGASDAELTTSTHATCAAVAAVANAKAYRSKTTGGCTEVAPSAPRGTLTFEGEQTICCP